MKKFMLSVFIVLVSFQTGFSQEVKPPVASVDSYNDSNATNMADGRTVNRIDGSMVGLIRVSWPKGATTTPHNHANELIINVASGHLKAFSGGKEYTLKAGDVITIPSWVDHGFEALEDTVTYEAAGPG